MSANSALLTQIQQGKKLKKTVVNDRSAPILDGAAPPTRGGVNRRDTPSAPVPGSGGAAPQLGGLFAGGIPKLKPAGQTPSGPTLGKPPSIPKRKGTAPAAPVPPAIPSRTAPPLPPNRDAPGRAVPAPPAAPTTSLAPTPPRRPPPPARPVSPPSRRPPPPARPVSPPSRRPPPPTRPVSPPSQPDSSAPPSTPSRQVPFPPTRPSLTESPSLPARKVPPPPTTSGRAPPPPPPPRPSSTIKTNVTPSTPSQAARAIRPPPVRKVPQQDKEQATPSRLRSLSSAGEGAVPVMLGVSPASPAPPVHVSPMGMRGAVPGRRAVSVSNLNGAGSLNGIQRAVGARIPSPPPSSGPHIFPSSSDFPPPRAFLRTAKKYTSGNVRGSSFDVSALG